MSHSDTSSIHDLLADPKGPEVIHLPRGVIRGGLTARRDVTIVGHKSTIVQGSHSNPVLDVRGASVHLFNVNLVHRRRREWSATPPADSVVAHEAALRLDATRIAGGGAHSVSATRSRLVAVHSFFDGPLGLLDSQVEIQSTQIDGRGGPAIVVSGGTVGLEESVIRGEGTMIAAESSHASKCRLKIARCDFVAGRIAYLRAGVTATFSSCVARSTTPEIIIGVDSRAMLIDCERWRVRELDNRAPV
jgi:hypothetical protein